MNVDITLIHSIGKIAVTIIVILAFFLFTVKSSIKQANRLFAFFLLLVAFDLCGLFLYEWLIQHPLIDVFRRTTSLLQMPLIYFYVKSICYLDFKVKPTLYVHAAVFIFGLMLFVPRFIFLTPIEQSQFLQDSHTIELIIKKIIGEIQYFVYIYLIFKILINYKKIYQENFANYDDTSYRWLFQMAVIFLSAHVFSLTKDIMAMFANPAMVLLSHLITSIIVLGVTCWFVLKALYHPSITRGIRSDQKSVTSNKKNDPSYHLSKSGTQQEITNLNKFMHLQKAYMDPDITIESLAQSYGMPTKDLSTLINYHLGQNFFNFINTFRINKAKQLLENPGNKKISILQILYEVGFNSKSSFNTAFKRYTGQTPSSYRQKPLE